MYLTLKGWISGIRGGQSLIVTRKFCNNIKFIVYYLLLNLLFIIKF